MTWHNSSGDIRIAVVSDGHGGDTYVNSAVGARYACEAAIEILREVAKDVKHLSAGDSQHLAGAAARAIIAAWNEKIDAERKSASLKTYGCTLIAYLQTRNYWLGLQVGDGKFAIVDNKGRWSQPIPWDDRCILNYTTSICDASALEEFRFACGAEAPSAVFLSSDGIDSTFDDGALLYNFYNRVLQSAIDDGYDCVRSQLPEVLSHFSKIGSQDDMSLAVIINSASVT